MKALTETALEVGKYVLGGGSLPLLVLVFYLLFPEKTQVILSHLFYVFSFVFRKAHRRYVAYDLQGRVNGFVKRLGREVPGVGREKLKVQWVDASASRQAFLDGSKVVIRLRREDPDDLNFVHGTYLFTSQCLLQKAKRYLAVEHREAIDLVVCSKILKTEKQTVVSYFVEFYLHPKTRDPSSPTARLIDDFGALDASQLFAPVLLQELVFLGNKVFGGRRDNIIQHEVGEAIDFLKVVSQHRLGEEDFDSEFRGLYANFAIFILGKSAKVTQSLDPYVEYLAHLDRELFETVYVLSPAKHAKASEHLCEKFSGTYHCITTRDFKRPITRGASVTYQDTHLIVLRRKEIPMFVPSATAADAERRDDRASGGTHRGFGGHDTLFVIGGGRT